MRISKISFQYQSQLVITTVTHVNSYADREWSSRVRENGGFWIVTLAARSQNKQTTYAEDHERGYSFLPYLTVPARARYIPAIYHGSASAVEFSGRATVLLRSEKSTSPTAWHFGNRVCVNFEWATVNHTKLHGVKTI